MLFVLLIFACDGGETTEGGRCPEGQLEDQGRCVSVDCGRGAWGNLDLDEETIYVDAEAEDDGDGGEGAPLRTLSEGLAMAGELGWSTVAVAEGVYEENPEIGAELGGLRLAGRCAELVVLEGGERAPGLSVGSARGGPETFALSGFTLRGGDVGMEVRHGITRVSTSRFEENLGAGLLVMGDGVTVIVQESALEGARRNADDVGGSAMEVADGARASLSRVTVEGTEEAGLAAVGGTLALEEVSVHGAGDEDTSFAPLLWLEDATLTCRSCALTEGLGAGLYMRGSVASLEDSQIEGTKSSSEGGNGVVAVSTEDGTPSTLILEGSTITNVASSGIVGEGASLILERSSILESGELGVLAMSGADVYLEDLLIDGAVSAGVGVLGATLRGTGLEISDVGGAGIYLEDGVVSGLEEVHIHDLSFVEEVSGFGVLGIALMEGSRGTFTDLVIEDAYGAGVQVGGDSSLTLKEAQILRTHGSPLTSVGFGLNAFGGSQIGGESVSVRETEGIGFYVVGGSLKCTDCAITDSAYAGVALLVAGSARLYGDGSSCEISGTEGNASFAVGVGLVADTMGSGVGLNLEVDGCVIRDNATAGVYLAGFGSYFLQSSTIEGGVSPLTGVYPEGNAIVAQEALAWTEGAEHGLLVEDTTLFGSAGAALLLRGAGATITDDVVFSENTLDVLQQGCADASMSIACPEGAQCELCPPYDHRFEPIDFYLQSPEFDFDE